MGKIFASRRTRGKKSDWFKQFAQCIDEESGIVWVDEVADYMKKPVGQIKQKVESLAEEFGEEQFYKMVTAASHQYYSGRTCVGFDERPKERKRRYRNKGDEDLAQLKYLADHLDSIEDGDDGEEEILVNGESVEATV